MLFSREMVRRGGKNSLLPLSSSLERRRETANAGIGVVPSASALPPPRAGWHKRAAPSRSLVTVSPFGVVSARIERGGAITRLSPRPHSARERTARWTAAAPHPPRDISLPVPAGIDKRRCSRRSHRGRIAGRSGRTDLRRRQEEALEEEEEEDASRVNVCERGGGCADRSGSKVSRPI